MNRRYSEHIDKRTSGHMKVGFWFLDRKGNANRFNEALNGFSNLQNLSLSDFLHSELDREVFNYLH